MFDQNRLTDPAWAWVPYEPDAKRPWNLRLAGHLLRRAGFGASWPELQRALAEGPRRTVGRLLRPAGDVERFNREYDRYEAGAASGAVEALRAWWLRRMIHTPHPLLEKMTLFWHSHFGVSAAAVPDTGLMHEHVQLLRHYALGNFGSLLEKVSRDPATLLSLGAAANRKALPNEDFARRFLEQFGVGEGNYTEEDVRDVARSFTGMFVLRLQIRFFDREHDSGEKVVFGHKGRFRGDDVVQIVLKQPAAARLIVRKLYGWLISETDQPGDALLAPLAVSLAAGWQLARLVETMLRSNLFYSRAAYRQRIKCPVEFAVGIVRGLQGNPSTARLGRHLAALGQDLYRPPTVKGWIGGRHWLNRTTLIGRSNLARALVASTGPYAGKLDPEAVAKEHGFADAASAKQFLLDLFLQGDLDDTVQQALSTAAPGGGEAGRGLRELAHLVISLPEFQLA